MKNGIHLIAGLPRSGSTLLAALLLAGPGLALAQTAIPDAPPAFGLAGRAIILTVHAEGAQIYECKTDAGGKSAWVFREPIATLLVAGKTVGRHYRGPTWELSDGGAVTGKTSMTLPGATASDVALLKLDVAEHLKTGVLDQANIVTRLNTRGGVASGPCARPGDLQTVAYSADYSFLK